MKHWKNHLLTGIACLATAIAQTSCSSIDEDLSDCDVDMKGTYRHHLVTNENREIARVLGDETAIGDDLREHLKDVFADYGRDIALDFYALPELTHTLPLTGTMPTEMNATERSFDIFMSIFDYTHLAVTNVRDNGAVALSGNDNCRTAQLSLQPQPPYETTKLEEALASQHTGLFTGRRQLTGITYGEQRYDMPLYIVNSAAAIVLDPRYPRTTEFTDVRIYTTGFADAFNVCDSVYTYPDNDYYVRADEVALHNTDWLCYCAVSMPSREPVYPTRQREDVDEPTFRYDDCGQAVWYYDCYVTMASGTITRTTIGVRHPLRAGQLKIIKGWIDDVGVVRLHDNELTVSSDLDWTDGLIFRK